MVLEVLCDYEKATVVVGNKAKLSGRPIEIISDSLYAQNMLMNGYKASKNVEQIDAIKTAIDERKRTTNNALRIHWVQGHSGIAENEFVDHLANEAAKSSHNDLTLLKTETLPTRKQYISQDQ